MNFFSFHIGDYMVHTRHLTLMEDLAYRRTLDLYYTHEGSLPTAADTARRIGMKDHETEVAAVLAEFFPEGRNKRADEELAKMHAKQDNARASVVRRTLASREHDASITQASREHHATSRTNTNTNTNTKEEKGAAPRSVAPPSPDAFDGTNAQALNGKAVVMLSPGWELPEEWGEAAVALGFKPQEALHEGEKYRQYWTAGKGSGKRRTVKGWRQSWSNWLSTAAERRR